MAKYLSIGSWAYTIGPYEKNPVSFEDVVTKLKELKFEGVELGGFPPHPNPDDCPTADDRARVRGLVEDAGLKFSGLAANLWKDENHFISKENNSNVQKDFQKNVDFCKDLGIKTIRVDSLEPPSVLETMDPQLAMDRAVATFKILAQRAADSGLNVCWEFEPGFAFNKPTEIINLVKAVDAPNFGVLYDTCHANMVAKVGSRQPGEKETLSGGALELLEKLKGHITHIHLIDSDDQCHKDDNGEDETSAHPPFGEGHLDFDKLIPALIDCGVPHDWWCIDLCFWPNAWDATEKCQIYLDQARQKYNLAP